MPISINAPLMIPDEWVDELTAAITKQVANRIEKLIKVSDLSEYPTRSEIRKVLHVGEDRISEWEAGGLRPVRGFGDKTVRYDRDDIKEYLNSTKY